MKPRLFTMRKRSITAAAFACLFIAGSALAYPEYQQYVQDNSGRNVDCALCHTHSNGPVGLRPGQIGALSSQELSALSQARAAFEPGQEVHSPILNEFGNHIMSQLGKTKVLELRTHPQDLALALGLESDLDKDGIPDATEYLQGTHALNSHSGDPWLLFKHNVKSRWIHLLMLLLATASGIYGLTNILHWIDAKATAAKQQRKELMEHSGDEPAEPTNHLTES